MGRDLEFFVSNTHSGALDGLRAHPDEPLNPPPAYFRFLDYRTEEQVFSYTKLKHEMFLALHDELDEKLIILSMLFLEVDNKDQYVAFSYC